MDFLESPQPTEGGMKTSYRRLETEIYKLVRLFKNRIEASEELKRRVSFFWPTEEFLQRVLFALAGDIPRGQNPLWEEDRSEKFPQSTAAEVSSQNLATQESERSFQGRRHKAPSRNYSGALSIHMGADETLHRRRKRSNLPACVHWLGLRGAENGFAAIKLSLPGTFEPWITWTNRLILFLFMPIPGYSTPEDFVSCLGAPDNSPFPMRCDDPLCIRLTHIQVTSKFGKVDKQQPILKSLQQPTPLSEAPPSVTGQQRSPLGNAEASLRQRRVQQQQQQHQIATDSGSGSSVWQFDSNTGGHQDTANRNDTALEQLAPQRRSNYPPSAIIAPSGGSSETNESYQSELDNERDAGGPYQSSDSDNDSGSSDSSDRGTTSPTALRSKTRRGTFWSPGFN